MGPSLEVRNCGRALVFFRSARHRTATSSVVTVADAPGSDPVALGAPTRSDSARAKVAR